MAPRAGRLGRELRDAAWPPATLSRLCHGPFTTSAAVWRQRRRCLPRPLPAPASRQRVPHLADMLELAIDDAEARIDGGIGSLDDRSMWQRGEDERLCSVTTNPGKAAATRPQSKRMSSITCLT